MAAITVAIVGAAVPTAAALINGGGQDAAMVRSIVDRLSSAGGCQTASRAAGQLRADLDGAGVTHWVIELAESVTQQDCVTPAVFASNRTVLLIRAVGPDTAQALESVATQLLDRCLDEQAARDLLGSVLRTSGVTGYSIRNDGPLAYPSERRDQIEAHLRAGCVIYSGSGSDAAGKQVFYLGVGRED